MAYTPHTWQANELVTPEKLNAIEIGLGNTVSNSGDNVISGSLKVTGLRTVQGSNASSAQLLFNDKSDSQLAEILVSENAHQMFFRIYATDHQNSSSDGKYRQYFFETTPTGLSSQETWKILSTKNVVDNLTSTSTSDVLSANMGKTLNDSKLNLSGGTLTGGLTTAAQLDTKGDVYFHSNNSQNGVYLKFSRGDSTTNTMVRLAATSTGQFTIREFNADSTSGSDAASELYWLPSPDEGINSQQTYAILTSKNKITVAQGGTNATTAAEARTNLGITPANIGALANNGDTMTGDLKLTSTLYFNTKNSVYSSGRIAVSDKGQFYFYGYSEDNSAESDSKREAYFLPKPATGLSAQQTYQILTSKNLVTVGQGGTGKSTFSANRLLCGNGTNAIEELDGVGTSGQFLRSNGNAKPSWVTLSESLIPSLSAEKITSGTFTTARIPNLTRSKITDLKFNSISLPDTSGSSTVDKSGNETIIVPNGRGIIFISRIQNNVREFGIYHIAAGSTTIHHNNGIPQGITVSKSSNTSDISITLSNTYNTITHRITWILYT